MIDFPPDIARKILFDKKRLEAWDSILEQFKSLRSPEPDGSPYISITRVSKSWIKPGIRDGWIVLKRAEGYPSPFMLPSTFIERFRH